MSAPVEVDLVVFEVGGSRYAADLTQVSRIDAPDKFTSVGEPLGRPHRGRRALVFHDREGREFRLHVDEVHGVHRVAREALRRLPVAVPASGCALGAWLDGEATVILVDLHATLAAAA